MKLARSIDLTHEDGPGLRRRLRMIYDDIYRAIFSVNASLINLDGGDPYEVFGGIDPIDCGGA